MSDFRVMIQELGGYTAVADVCGVRSPSVHYWAQRGLPKTEWTGETEYAVKIAQLASSQEKAYTVDAIRELGHPSRFRS